MIPSETCEDCGCTLTHEEQLMFLFMCRECHEQEAAYLKQIIGSVYEHGHATHQD